MPSQFKELAESLVVDIEGVRSLEKSDVDFGISWLLAFVIAIVAVAIGWGASKVKKQATEEDDSKSDAEDTK